MTTQYRTPGHLIEDLLAARGWTQAVLAAVLGIDRTGINKLVKGARPIDAEMALRLSEIFGLEAEQFLELQKAYDLARARIEFRPDPDLANRAQLFGSFPIAEMIQRRWIEAADVQDMPKIESSLAKFFGVSNISEIEVFPHAAKRTNVFGPCLPIQLAWLYRVKGIASEMLVARKFTPTIAQSVLSQLKPLMIGPEPARKVPKILAEAGIRFMIVEALSGSKIDGVTTWLDDHSPVIAMTLRHDRIDNFWFVLRHELEHVIQGHGKISAMLDVELEGDRAGTGQVIAEEERIANSAASDFCVPNRSLDSFVARKSPLFRDNDLLGFAATLKVHPGIAVGQLQHRTGRYEIFRNHLVKVRASIAPSAMVDGWGDVVPVGLQ